MAESNYLHILPDICKLDIEEFEDSALGSLDDLDIVTDEKISYNLDEKLSYRSDGASEYEIEMLNEIKYLKTELEGERVAKQKYEKNYLETKESCIQLHKYNKELEKKNRILRENSEKDEKKMSEKIEEIDHNMELIKDLSEVASEVYENTIRYKDEIQYWKQKCGWLSQQLNQIQLSKPEVEARCMQKYEERNAKTQKYIKHIKREKIEEVQKLREKFNVMLNESNKKVQELDMELVDMYEELRNLEDELSEKDTNAKKEKEESEEIIQTFQEELAMIKRHLECSEEKNKMQAALITKIKNNTPKTAARMASPKGTRQKTMKQKLENTEEEEKVYIIPSLDLVTTPSSASTGDIEGKAIDLFNVYGESNILWPELMDDLY